MSPAPEPRPSHPLGRSGEEVRALFGGIAPRYDFLNHALSFGMDALWRRRLAAVLPVAESPLLLDLCCGTGDMALELARRRGGVVVGADFALPMVLLGARKCARAGLAGRVHLCAADGLRLPFPEAGFDGATVTFGLRNLADLDAGLAELWRVLRPGGALGVLEFLRPPSGPGAALGAWYRRAVLPRLAVLLGGDRAAYTYLPSTIDAFDSEAEFLARLERLGFAPLRCERRCFGVVSLVVARKR